MCSVNPLSSSLPRGERTNTFSFIMIESALLPLPEGEGRGEGAIFTETVSAIDYAKQSLVDNDARHLIIGLLANNSLPVVNRRAGFY